MQSIGLSALEVVLPWIMQAFAGYLPVEQVLALWDRVVSTGRLEIISVAAAAVFAFRRHPLLEVKIAVVSSQT